MRGHARLPPTLVKTGVGSLWGMFCLLDSGLERPEVVESLVHLDLPVLEVAALVELPQDLVAASVLLVGERRRCALLDRDVVDDVLGVVPLGAVGLVDVEDPVLPLRVLDLPKHCVRPAGRHQEDRHGAEWWLVVGHRGSLVALSPEESLGRTHGSAATMGEVGGGPALRGALLEHGVAA